MKNTWFLFLTLLTSVNLNGQQFAEVDRYAQAAPHSAKKNIKALASYLTSSYNSDLEKVRSIYVWVTHNIRYDMDLYLSGQRNKEILAEDVLRSGRSVCQGYSELFKSLCDSAGILCYVVSGYSKGYGYNEGKIPVQSDHAWNVVKIEGKWYLIDATWGAGFINQRNKYEKKFSNYYFLTPPSIFIYTHLPSDPMWQLLPCPIKLNEFSTDSVKMATMIKTDTCYWFADTIAAFLQLPLPEQNLKTARNAFAYNPENYDVMGYALIGYAFDLSKNMPDPNDDQKKFIDLQRHLLKIYEEAIDVFSKSKTPQGRNGLNVSKQNLKIIKKNLNQFK